MPAGNDYSYKSYRLMPETPYTFNDRLHFYYKK